MIYEPYAYQQHATEHILQSPSSGLFLDMGLGKTISTLTALDQLLNETLEARKVLVIAPKFVALNTWPDEIAKWEHTRHLAFSIVVGTETARISALRAKADIYIINRENVAWLVSFYASGFPFDTVVIDELSSFKNPKAVRFKALRRVRPLVKRVIGLTGTPAPQGLLDLWSQLYLLDQGERLGKHLTHYRDKYFNPGRRNGHIVFDYKLKQEKELLGDGFYENEIYEKISDICISMKKEDWLSLPETVYRTTEIHLPPSVMDRYYKFEREQVLQMQDLDDISAVNAMALSSKLQQFANGAIYDDKRNYHVLHDAKLDALEEMVEAANGNPVLVLYNFRHDLDRIRERLRACRPEEVHGKNVVQRWNNREIPVLVGHPASMGHGLNLQHGGNLLFWFGNNWSLELYQQANARLPRPGQTKSVFINRLCCKGTIDEDILAALDNKEFGQERLLQAVKARIDKYR